LRFTISTELTFFAFQSLNILISLRLKCLWKVHVFCASKSLQNFISSSFKNLCRLRSLRFTILFTCKFFAFHQFLRVYVLCDSLFFASFFILSPLQFLDIHVLSFSEVQRGSYIPYRSPT
jgi:hypothetical protein